LVSFIKYGGLILGIHEILVVICGGGGVVEEVVEHLSLTPTDGKLPLMRISFQEGTQGELSSTRMTWKYLNIVIPHPKVCVVVQPLKHKD